MARDTTGKSFTDQTVTAELGNAQAATANAVAEGGRASVAADAAEQVVEDIEGAGAQAVIDAEAARDVAVGAAAQVEDSLTPVTPKAVDPAYPLVIGSDNRVPLALTEAGLLEAYAGLGPVTTEALTASFTFLRALSLTTPTRVPVVVGSDGRVAVWLEDGRIGALPSSGLVAEIANAILGTGSAGGLPVGYDIILVAGQSNAVGYAAAASSVFVAPGLGLHWSHAAGTPTVGTLQPVVDPIHHLDDGILPLSHPRGSAWPAFALEYVRRTRRGVLFVNAAMGGTGLLETSNVRGDWSASGNAKSTLFAQSVAMVRAARDYATEELALDVRLRGVVWAQGESDGDAAVSEATYRAALDALAARYRVALGAGCPLYVVRTGRYAPGGTQDTVAYEAIRRAQVSHCAADPLSHLVHAGAVDYVARGLMTDEFHYTSAGYDELGTLAARNIARQPETAGAMLPTP